MQSATLRHRLLLVLGVGTLGGCNQGATDTTGQVAATGSDGARLTRRSACSRRAAPMAFGLLGALLAACASAAPRSDTPPPSPPVAARAPRTFVCSSEEGRRWTEPLPVPAASSSSSSPPAASSSASLLPKVNQADRVLASVRDQARGCFQRQLDGGHPTAQGWLPFRLGVASDGRVVTVCVGTTGTLPEGILPCMGTSLGALRFDPPEGGQRGNQGLLQFQQLRLRQGAPALPPSAVNQHGDGTARPPPPLALQAHPLRRPDGPPGRHSARRARPSARSAHGRRRAARPGAPPGRPPSCPRSTSDRSAR